MQAVGGTRVDLLVLGLLICSLAVNVVLAFKIYVHHDGGSLGDSGPNLSPEEFRAATADDVPSIGDRNAPVTIILFSDFQCPFCARLAVALEHLPSSDAQKLRIVFHEYPLVQHRFAHEEAELAECVAAQSRVAFWSFYQFAYKHEPLSTDVTSEALDFLEKRRDISRPELHACITNHKSARRVSEDIRLGQRLGVRETPTLFLDRIRLTGEMRQEAALLNLIHLKIKSKR